MTEDELAEKYPNLLQNNDFLAAGEIFISGIMASGIIDESSFLKRHTDFGISKEDAVAHFETQLPRLETLIEFNNDMNVMGEVLGEALGIIMFNENLSNDIELLRKQFDEQGEKGIIINLQSDYGLSEEEVRFMVTYFSMQ